MRGRHHGGFAPEVAPLDLEGGPRGKVNMAAGGAKMPFQNWNRQTSPASKGHGHGDKGNEGMKNTLMIIGGVWVAGYFVMGYPALWPLYYLLDMLGYVFEIPLLGSILSLIWTPISWILSLVGLGGGHGAMTMMAQGEVAQEMRLEQAQVPMYVESYVKQYGDAALIFAAHDGYPQIVHGMLMGMSNMGYRELIDAADDNGNTALIYAAAKGLSQTTVTLLRAGADPDIPNTQAGGRTALMEAAGSGHKAVVSSLMQANATVNLQDDLLNTALHYAAYHGHLQVVQELLRKDAAADMKNSYGHTPASYALTNGNKGISDLLNRAQTRRGRERLKEQTQDPADPQSELMKALGLAGKEKAKATDPQADLMKALGLGDKEQEKKKEEDQQSALMKALGLGGKEDTKSAKDDDDEDGGQTWLKTLQDHLKKAAGESGGKHVKGAAEDLHKRADFAPETEGRGISKEERKALEAQIAALKKQSEDAELKAQKRIVELLEKSADHQRARDEAEREARSHKMNVSELAMRNQELHARHAASELEASEEKARADRLHTELQDTRLEIDRHRSRADSAERERDEHVEASRRHEDNVRRKQDEVEDYLSRLRRQSQEMEQLREENRRREQELRQHKARLQDLEDGMRRAGAAVPPAAAAPSPPTPPPAPPPTPPPAPPPVPPLAAAPATASAAVPPPAEPAAAAEEKANREIAVPAAAEGVPPLASSASEAPTGEPDVSSEKEDVFAALEADGRQET